MKYEREGITYDTELAQLVAIGDGWDRGHCGRCSIYRNADGAYWSLEQSLFIKTDELSVKRKLIEQVYPLPRGVVAMVLNHGKLVALTDEFDDEPIVLNRGFKVAIRIAAAQEGMSVSQLLHSMIEGRAA